MTDSDLWIQVSDVRKHYAIGNLALRCPGIRPILGEYGAWREDCCRWHQPDDPQRRTAWYRRAAMAQGSPRWLHMVAGLSAPTAGKIDVHGRVTAIMTLGLGLREHASGRGDIFHRRRGRVRSRVEIDAVIDEIIDSRSWVSYYRHAGADVFHRMKSPWHFAMISCLGFRDPDR